MSSSRNSILKAGLLIPRVVLLLSFAPACSAPAAPPVPTRQGAEDGSDPCATDSKTGKTTKSKSSDIKSSGKTTAKKTKDGAALKESEKEECPDKPSTANAAGTTLATNPGILPSQLQAGTQQPIIVGNQPPTQQLALTPTYKVEISAYLATACTGCHSGGFFKPSPNLSTYDAASKAAAASLKSMQDGRMPTQTRATEAEIKTFAAWVSAGTPQ